MGSLKLISRRFEDLLRMVQNVNFNRLMLLAFLFELRADRKEFDSGFSPLTLPQLLTIPQPKYQPKS